LQGGSLTDTVAQFDREGGSLLPDRRLSKTEIFKKWLFRDYSIMLR
jgi:hypothetical protein